MARRDYDRSEVLRRAAAGESDKAIAAAVGVARGTVALARRRAGLPNGYAERRKAVRPVSAEAWGLVTDPANRLRVLKVARRCCPRAVLLASRAADCPRSGGGAAIDPFGHAYAEAVFDLATAAQDWIRKGRPNGDRGVVPFLVYGLRKWAARVGRTGTRRRVRLADPGVADLAIGWAADRSPPPDAQAALAERVDRVSAAVAALPAAVRRWCEAVAESGGNVREANRRIGVSKMWHEDGNRLRSVIHALRSA